MYVVRPGHERADMKFMFFTGWLTNCVWHRKDDGLTPEYGTGLREGHTRGVRLVLFLIRWTPRQLQSTLVEEV